MKRTIANFAWFKAAHGGNFIEQIRGIRKSVEIEGNKFLFIVPELAKDTEWFKKLQKEGMLIETLPMYENSKNRIKTLKKIIIKYNVNLAHLHFAMIEKELAIACNKTNCQFIEHIRAEIMEHSTYIGKLITYVKYRYIYKNAHFIVLNKQTKDTLMRYYINSSKIDIIPNGISFDRLDCKKDKLELCKIFNIPTNSYCFLMMGYDIIIKGVDIAIEAMKEVRKSNTNAVLAIVMSSHLEDNTNIIEKWFDGKLPNWIILLKANQSIGEYYRLSDCFISASRTEGFPNSLVEAMYSKLPAIISNIPSTIWSKEYSTIQVYEVLSNNELANKMEERIQNLVSDKNLENVKQNMILKYSIEEWVKKIKKIYIKYT